MSNAARDENSVPTRIAALNTDGATIMRLYVNPSTGAIKVSDANTGTYPAAAGHRALHDENGATTMTGVSTADGQTVLNALINASHQLLIKSS